MVRVPFGRLRAINLGSVVSTGEVWNDLAVLLWKPQGVMILSNMHKGTHQTTGGTQSKSGDKQLHVFVKHAEMVSFAVATFNINQAVQLLFPTVVRCSQPQLNYCESVARLPTRLEPRQCFFNQRIMERTRCVVLESTRSHDLIKHA